MLEPDWNDLASRLPVRENHLGVTMSRRKETLLEILRALGFVLAVVVGGIFIAGVIESYIGPREAGIYEETGEEGELPRPD